MCLITRQGYTPSSWLTATGVHFNHLAQCLEGFLHYGVSSHSLPNTVLFGRKSLSAQPMLLEIGSMFHLFRVYNELKNDFGNSSVWKMYFLTLPIYLFNYYYLVDFSICLKWIINWKCMLFTYIYFLKILFKTKTFYCFKC